MAEKHRWEAKTMSELEKFKYLLDLLSPEQVEQLRMKLPDLLAGCARAGIRAVENCGARFSGDSHRIRCLQMIVGGRRKIAPGSTRGG